MALGASTAPIVDATPLSSESATSQRFTQRVKPQLVRYETTTEDGSRAPVTATLYDTPDAKGLVAFAPGTRGLGDHCAPSNSPAILRTAHQKSVNIDYERGIVRKLVDAGYRVIVTDYVGLGTPGTHTYLNRVDQGHAVIDAARYAAHDGEKIAFWGYSQGGGASAAAAELVADYAPELNVVAAFVGAPPADPLAVLEQATSKQISAVAGFAAVSFASTYPDFREALYAELNEEGVDTLETLSNACMAEAPRVAPKPFTEYTKSGESLAELAQANATLRARLDQNKLGRVPTSMPTLVLTNPADDLVPSQQVTQLARDYCSVGAPVEYRAVAMQGVRPEAPFANVDGSAHTLPLYLESSNAITWLNERFDPDAAAFTATCPIPDTPPIQSDHPILQYTNETIAAIFLGILGVLSAVGMGAWLTSTGLTHLFA